MFRRRVPNHCIPVHPDNVAKNDWIIVLEAGTIVGPSPDRLRVARATREKKIVKKYNVLLRPKYYLVVEGYDPRIHALYFCPQLYRSDSDGNLVALQGEEIGRLLAKLVEGAVAQKRPWYDPAEKSPNEPIISTTALSDLDSLVVDAPVSGEPLQLEFARGREEGAREPATLEAGPEEKHASTTTSATARLEERSNASNATSLAADRPNRPRYKIKGPVRAIGTAARTKEVVTSRLCAKSEAPVIL